LALLLFGFLDFVGVDNSDVVLAFKRDGFIFPMPPFSFSYWSVKI
jgi:hypothetical protein